MKAISFSPPPYRSQTITRITACTRILVWSKSGHIEWCWLKHAIDVITCNEFWNTKRRVLNRLNGHIPLSFHLSDWLSQQKKREPLFCYQSITYRQPWRGLIMPESLPFAKHCKEYSRISLRDFFGFNKLSTGKTQSYALRATRQNA